MVSNFWNQIEYSFHWWDAVRNLAWGDGTQQLQAWLETLKKSENNGLEVQHTSIEDPAAYDLQNLISNIYREENLSQQLDTQV